MSRFQNYGSCEAIPFDGTSDTIEVEDVHEALWLHLERLLDREIASEDPDENLISGALYVLFKAGRTKRLLSKEEWVDSRKEQI